MTVTVTRPPALAGLARYARGRYLSPLASLALFVVMFTAVVTRFWLLSAMAAIAGVCIFYGDWLSAVGFAS